MKNILILVFAVAGIFLSNALNAAPPKTKTVTIQTSAVCGMCEETISKALNTVKGVKSITMDNNSKAITVTYNPKHASVDQLRTAIAKAGYDADAVPADPQAYNALHGCCKKDAKH